MRCDEQQSKKQQQDRKDRTVELVREHKKKEREAIKQGKKPFYLKKGNCLSCFRSNSH